MCRLLVFTIAALGLVSCGGDDGPTATDAERLMQQELEPNLRPGREDELTVKCNEDGDRAFVCDYHPERGLPWARVRIKLSDDGNQIEDEESRLHPTNGDGFDYSDCLELDDKFSQEDCDLWFGKL